MTTQDSKPAASKGPTNEQAQEVDIALIKQPWPISRNHKVKGELMTLFGSHVARLGRCLAPDLVGVGESDFVRGLRMGASG